MTNNKDKELNIQKIKKEFKKLRIISEPEMDESGISMGFEMGMADLTNFDDLWNFIETKLIPQVEKEMMEKVKANISGLFPINMEKKWTSKEVVEYIMEFYSLKFIQTK